MNDHPLAPADAFRVLLLEMQLLQERFDKSIPSPNSEKGQKQGLGQISTH